MKNNISGKQDNSTSRGCTLSMSLSDPQQSSSLVAARELSLDLSVPTEWEFSTASQTDEAGWFS